MERCTFSHLALTVHDLERQATFYCSALDFHRGAEYSSRGRRVAALMEIKPSGFRGMFLRLGDLFLELLQYSEPGPAAPPRRAAEPGFAHISLVVPDVQGTVAAVRAAGGSLRQTFEHSFTGTGTPTVIAFCTDPEGNRIEFIEHPDDAETAGHATFLGLAELGWPATGGPCTSPEEDTHDQEVAMATSTPLEERDLPTLDIDDPAFRAAPHEVISRVRDHGRFAMSRRGIEVLGHDDVLALLLDERLRTQDTAVWTKYGAQEMLTAFVEDGLLSAMQGDRHDRVRRVFLAGFRARHIEAQRPAMQAIAERLVEQLPPDGCDIVEHFTSPFPMRVLCTIVGIPTEDIPQFSAAATQLHLLAQTPLEPGFPAIERALQHLWDYCIALVGTRRRAPQDDALSALIAAQETEGRLTDAELVWNIANLIFAGQDTTRYQLASAIRAICEVPGLWQRMADDPEIIPWVAEETLRTYPVTSFVIRIPTEDIVYEGVRMATGRRVVLNFQAASRDPRRFSDPHVFTPRKPGRHTESFDVPFGLGKHYCLGAALAKSEIVEALQVLVGAWESVDVAGEPTMTAPTGMLFGPEELPIRYVLRR